MKRWLVRVLVIFFILLLGIAIAGWVANEPRPTGVSGEGADALARRMESAVDKAAWDRTRAVRWNFGDRYVHLWDKERNLARIRWGDAEVLLDLTTKKGVATEGGKKIEGAAADELFDKAYRRWVNDSFWLNPVVKLFDPDTERSIVQLEDGRDALLVTFGNGGVTPGDAYLWMLGDDDLPKAWKMWVSIIPVGGLEVSWEKWITLSTGAKIATFHSGLISFEMKDVQGAESLTDLEEDPFGPLASPPSSQPAEP